MAAPKSSMASAAFGAEPCQKLCGNAFSYVSQIDQGIVRAFYAVNCSGRVAAHALRFCSKIFKPSIGKLLHHWKQGSLHSFLKESGKLSSFCFVLHGPKFLGQQNEHLAGIARLDIFIEIPSRLKASSGFAKSLSSRVMFFASCLRPVPKSSLVKPACLAAK